MYLILIKALVAGKDPSSLFKLFIHWAALFTTPRSGFCPNGCQSSEKKVGLFTRPFNVSTYRCKAPSARIRLKMFSF